MKRKIPLKIIIILLLIILIVVPSINAINFYNSENKVEITDTINESNDEFLHMLCYIESGEVLHENVDRIGLFFEDISDFGIYIHAHVDLIGWQEGARLTVKNIYGTTTYDHDVSVSIIGFIGCIFPTVPSFIGILKGLAFIVKVSPLNW